MPADMPWPADRVERRLVAALIPYAQNARTHSPEQVAQLAASIQQWGWTVPVLVDEQGTIIAGHGRVLAARKLGLLEVPVMVAAGWSEAQRRAYVLADNKLALNAGWDEQLLSTEMRALDDLGFDLTLTAFAEKELRALMPVAPPEDGLADEDDVPEPPQATVTRPGDLWILGRHRLLCGDSTNREHVARVMGGAEADLCFTSPPYGQQRSYKSGGISDWDALMQGVFSLLPVKHDAQVLVNLGLIHRDGEWLPYWDGWIEWMRAAGWRSFGWYVWDQGPGLPGDWNGRLAPSHEFIFHFNRVAERARKTKDSKWAGHTNHGSGLRAADGSVTAYTAAGKAVQDKKIPDSVVRVMRHKGRGIEVAHPAVFPVDLVSEMLTAFSDPDDLVFEPFIGSGTQIISAEKNARSCYGLELASEYADVAVRRWQLFTGQIAVLEGDGRGFDQVAAARSQGDQAGGGNAAAA
jgi:DNA modification methylase